MSKYQHEDIILYLHAIICGDKEMSEPFDPVMSIEERWNLLHYIVQNKTKLKFLRSAKVEYAKQWYQEHKKEIKAKRELRNAKSKD